MSTKKYRPYLSLDELEIILSELKRGGLFTTKPIITYLEMYILQIKAGVRKENHQLQPPLEEKLGFIDSPPKPSPQELYKKWERHQTLTADEMNYVYQYRYENNLMTSAEESVYESSLGIN